MHWNDTSHVYAVDSQATSESLDTSLAPYTTDMSKGWMK